MTIAAIIRPQTHAVVYQSITKLVILCEFVLVIHKAGEMVNVDVLNELDELVSWQ